MHSADVKYLKGRFVNGMIGIISLTLFILILYIVR